MGLVLNCSIEEVVGLSAITVAGSINSVLINDIIALTGYTESPGAPFVTLSLDTEKLLPAIHSYPFFTSFCNFDGGLYATAADGIHKIDGDTDNGETIHTGMVFKSDFGVSNVKRIRCIILDGDIEDIQIKAESNSKSGTYPAKQNRVYVGREIEGKDWELRIADFDRLDGFEVIPTIGRRR